MRFDEMNAMQRRLHNACIVLEAEGDEHGFTNMLLEAIGEIEQQRQDAARYRWLRAQHQAETMPKMFVVDATGDCVERDLDGAIDAAMLKTPNDLAKPPVAALCDRSA